MARNGTISIRPSEDNIMRGREPGGSHYGYLVGANNSGTAPFSTNWPYCDAVKNSYCWQIHSGSAAYTINRQDQITALSSGLVLKKWVIEPPEIVGATVPKFGSYRVRWTGTGDISAGNSVSPTSHNAYVSPTSGSGEFTFTLPSGQSLWLYARNGTILTLECVHSEDIATYDGGQIWRQDWLDTISSFNQRIIRILVTQDYIDEGSKRTLPSALSYISRQDHTTGLLNEDNGIQGLHMPWEVQCDLANKLNVDLAIVLQPFYTNSYIAEIGQIVDQNLEPSRRVFCETPNETWNEGGEYFIGCQWMGLLNVPKTLLTLTPGSNTVVSPGHTFTNGTTFRTILSPNSGVFGSGESVFDPCRYTLRATNVTSGGFDMVLDSTSAAAIPEAGLTEVYAYKLSDNGGQGLTSYTNVDYGTGQWAVDAWDSFKTHFANPGRVKEMIGTQQGWVERTLNRIGINGTNGRYDFISHGAYFGMGDVGGVYLWESGDTLEDMLADGEASVDNTLASFDAVIAAGVPANKLFCYEGGQHYLCQYITIPPGGNVSALRAEAQTAFELLNHSEEMGLLYARLHQGLADRGVYGGCTANGAINPWGLSGFWYAIEYEGDAIDPRVQVMIDYNGVVEPA